MLCSLDKQMSDGFQWCSGDLVGSGVTTQGSWRLNSEHTFLNSKLIICWRRRVEENTDGNIKIPFPSLIILRCVVLAASGVSMFCKRSSSRFFSSSSVITLCCEYFPLQPTATDLIIQLCKYFQISLVRLCQYLVNSQLMITRWTCFHQTDSCCGKWTTGLPKWSWNEISNS